MLRRDQRITSAIAGKLYGRETELRTLRATLRQAKNVVPEEEEQGGEQEEHDNNSHVSNNGVHFVFVSGEAGSGKTSVVDAAFKDLDCLYGCGKFEEKRQGRPFAALVAAISDMCHKMKESETIDYKAVLSKSRGKDSLALLSSVVPLIAEILGVDDVDESESGSAEAIDLSLAGSLEGLEQLKYVLRTFFCTISLPQRPVVLFLDDLQWIDPHSMKILKLLVSNPELKHLVFVGSFRDDEADEDSLVSKWISSLKENDHETTQIKIGNLDSQQLALLLQDLLKTDGGNLKDLVDLIHSRTKGNIFHTLHLLDYLHAKRLLEYSLSTYQWTWDLSAIRKRTSVAANVVEVVLAKTDDLSEEEHWCLKVCGCLGYKFDLEVLVAASKLLLVAEHERLSNVEACVHSLVKEGLLERLDEERLKFPHDRIHHAAILLIPTELQRTRLHFQIGKALWDAYGFDDDTNVCNAPDRILFVVAEQLNAGRDMIEDSSSFPVKMAHLNLQVAKRAARMSAFAPAAEFLETGIGLLEFSTMWVDHYSLCLELHTMLAEMCYCAGEFEKHKAATSQVLEHAHGVDDSIRASVAMLACLAAENDQVQMLSKSLEILSALGQPFESKPPKRFVKRRLMEVRQRLDSLKDDEIISLPMTTDTRIAHSIRIMSGLLQFSVIRPLDVTNSLAVAMMCRAVDLSLDHGLAPYSAAIFAVFAAHFQERGDIDGAYRLAALTKTLVTRPELKASRCKVLANVIGVNFWRQPISLLLDSAIEAHRVGMRFGDLFDAFFAAGIYCSLFAASGLPLDSLVDDLKNFCEQSLDYGQEFWLLRLAPLYQSVLNVTGRAHGNILDVSQGVTAKYRAVVAGGGAKGVGEIADYIYVMQIAFYCEDIDLAAEAVHILRDHHYLFIDWYLYQVWAFFLALIAIAQARRTDKHRVLKRRRHEQEALKHFEIVRSWVVDNRSINIGHKFMILEAEMMTLKGKKKINVEAMRSKYDKAIARSIKAGFLQDAALAAHLASHALAGEQYEEDYFDRALDLYTRWGAKGIVSHLVDKRQQQQQCSNGTKQEAQQLSTTPTATTQSSPPKTSRTAGVFRGRQHFDKRLAEEHRKLNASGGAVDRSAQSWTARFGEK